MLIWVSVLNEWKRLKSSMIDKFIIQDKFQHTHKKVAYRAGLKVEAHYIINNFICFERQFHDLSIIFTFEIDPPQVL